ncbi:MAG: hypothetical protein GY756_09995 [bacterium]|nr:hypothetical protein [bacterium]
MTLTHLGQDGYFQRQKESAYKTQTINSLVFEKLMEGTLMFEQQHIEKQDILNNRIPQDDQAGRKIVAASDLTFAMTPALEGDAVNLFLGLEDAVTGDGAATAYLHAWVIPITGTTAGVSWTSRQAIGSDLADEYLGIKCSKIVWKSDNEGRMQRIMTLVGVDRDDDDVARVSSVSVTALADYIFSNGAIQLTPSGVGQFTQKVNNFEFEVDLSYDEDGSRFKVGSDTADTPIFGSIPKCVFRCEIDAERRFEDWANELKEFAIDITITSPELAVATDPYKVIFEIGKAELISSVRRENANDNITMQLEFKIYGATTTNSGTDVVQAEIRVQDDTATYTSY